MAIFISFIITIISFFTVIPANADNRIVDEWNDLASEILEILNEEPTNQILMTAKERIEHYLPITKLKISYRLAPYGVDVPYADFSTNSKEVIYLSKKHWLANQKTFKILLILKVYLDNVYNSDWYGYVYNYVEENIDSKKNSPSDYGGGVLLYQNIKDGFNLGLELKDAQARCDMFKEIYNNKFFIIYCNFLEKNYTTYHIGNGMYQDHRIIGYTSYHSSETYSENTNYQALYLKTEETNQISYDYELVNVPYQYSYTEEHKVYGIEVYGLGAINESTPWTVLNSSDSMHDGNYSFFFENQKEAFEVCQRQLLRVQNKFMYHRAKCVAVKEQIGGKYYYQVMSQNPFLNMTPK